MYIPSGWANVILPVENTSPVGSNPVITFGVELVTGGDLLATPDRIWTVFADSILPLCDNSRTWGPVTVQLGNGAGDPTTLEGSLFATGGATITSVPPNAAVLVSKISAAPGKPGKGRYYWPFVADRSGVDEGGSWDSLANFQDAQTEFLEGLEAEGLPMVILHAGPEPAPSTVLSLVARNPLATQRRRLRR